jgi:SAM-dependent methyltransferase
LPSGLHYPYVIRSAKIDFKRKWMMALYDSIGRSYARTRQPDPRIAAALNAALGDASSVVNIGAGTGSYEPTDRDVIAVEPSALMIAQRPAEAARCLQGGAEALPLADGSVEAAMAVLSMHHWPDLTSGMAEMARVATKRAVMLTWVPDGPEFWLTRDYFPEILAHDRTIFPTTIALTSMLERKIGPTTIAPMPVPHDCIDGFLMSFWRRPQAYLDPNIRGGMSSFARINANVGLDKLRTDLANGEWHRRNGELLTLDAADVGYRIVTCEMKQ